MWSGGFRIVLRFWLGIGRRYKVSGGFEAQSMVSNCGSSGSLLFYALILNDTLGEDINSGWDSKQPCAVSAKVTFVHCIL